MNIINKNDFLEKELNIIQSIRDGNSTWNELVDFRTNYSGERVHRDTISKGFYLLKEFIDSGWVHKPEEEKSNNYNKNISINIDGSQNSEGKFEIDSEENLKNVEYLLKLHDYDPDEWELINSKSGFWDSNISDGKIKKMYASRIIVKPKKKEWSIESINEYLENKKFVNTREKIKPTNYSPDGEVLEICLPDIHMGLLSFGGETNDSYDIKIAKQRFNQCISDIIERIGNRKFSKIYLVPLGDLFHVDNASYSTNRNTLQDCDGRYTKMFNNTLDMMIDAIDTLSSFSKVHIPFISGNHSRVMEYTLIKALEMAFRNDDNIFVDSAPSPSKFNQFGNVLIGWTHGDCSIKNMSEWLQSHAREEFGKSKYVEIHCGHIHTTQTIEKNGMIIRYLPTICSSSSWENQQLYNRGIKTVVSFVWNPNNGLREMWYSNI